MGYKKRAKDTYESCKVLFEELHKLEEWFSVSHKKFIEERKKKLKVNESKRH